MNIEKVLKAGVKTARTIIPPEKTTSVAHKRNIGVSIKKLVPLARMVRKTQVNKALDFLAVYPKTNAKFIRKAISSARGNAVAKGYDPDDLYIDQIITTKGKYHKRMRIMGRGRTGMGYLKSSNITVIVKPKNEVTEEELQERRAKLEEQKKAKLTQTKKESKVQQQKIEEEKEQQKEEEKKNKWWPWG